MRGAALAVACALVVACKGGAAGESGLDTDTGARGIDTAEEPPPEADWCIDFEENSLINAGYGEETTTELYDGAIVFVAEEGDNWSGYNGEESIDLRGDYALGMRSNSAGEPSSVSIATTHVFTAEQDSVFWWQLSEVDDRGIYLGVDVMTPDSAVLGSKALPVETGGHLPGLELGHASISEIPELEVGEGNAGALVLQALDLSPWAGQEIKVRFYQHTKIEGNGFFTLLDDICHGPAPVLPLPADEELEHGA